MIATMKVNIANVRKSRLVFAFVVVDVDRSTDEEDLGGGVLIILLLEVVAVGGLDMTLKTHRKAAHTINSIGGIPTLLF